MGICCCNMSWKEDSNANVMYDRVYCFVNAKSGSGEGRRLLDLDVRELGWKTDPKCTCVFVDLLNKDDRDRTLDEIKRMLRTDLIPIKEEDDSADEKGTKAEEAFDDAESRESSKTDGESKAKSSSAVSNAKYHDTHSSKTLRCCCVVAGGDGTVKWVIGLLESIGANGQMPIGVVPFGTGNDTARTLGWGGYAPSNLVDFGLQGLRHIIRGFCVAPSHYFDTWRVSISLRKGGRFLTVDSDKNEVEDAAKTKAGGAVEVMINYFSIGMDAQIAYDFARNRKKTQMMNKITYGVQGMLKTVCPPPAILPLCESIKADGGDLKRVNPRAIAFVFQNIKSYASGIDIWSRSRNRSHPDVTFSDQIEGDGILEFMTISSSPQVMLGRLSRECQAKDYAIDLGRASEVYMQIDGEPYLVEKPKCVRISRGVPAKMLRRRQRK